MSKIFIVSTGTGNTRQLTQSALEALNKADLIVGYTKYLKDIESVIKDKETYSTGMTHEVDRCKFAIQKAVEGTSVALVSNGDANVYGMAGLMLEIIEENNLWDKIEVEIEPGITSFLAAASKTGAPVMNDFAVISLSNLLTPIEKIEKRLNSALDADFVLGIYNPLSHSRKEPYELFLSAVKKYRNDETPVVIAQNLGRENEKIFIKTVKELIEIGLDKEYVNMSTVLIIGSSFTRLIKSGEMIVTQRGYQKNYDYKL